MRRSRSGPSGGSSPRRRGTPVLAERDAEPDRFIPAQAGNTPHPPRASHRRAVHPRAGGEHFPHVLRESIHTGSSPRRRGTPARHARHREPHRFIPAQAGNTSSRAATAPRTAVHPRAGGEHPITDYQAVEDYGSSPRRRGTLLVRLRRGHVDRFIPAQAGNTPARRASDARVSVHPRAGGEHFWYGCAGGTSIGSSPRRAGNTPPRTSSCRAAPVHPRAGGEHMCAQ